jgi:thiamine-monophosphate kinase
MSYLKKNHEILISASKNRRRNRRENRIVDFLEKRFAGRSASIIKGVGDDAAVIRQQGAREDWVVTTDMLLEDVDFQKAWLTAGQLGHKSLAVNLSDLAAMGARPRFHIVSLGIPATIPDKWIVQFYQGLAKLASAHKTLLIGGDLSRSTNGIQVTITALGETWHRQAIYRSGGSAGDVLYVTGTLGKAAAGLELLRKEQTKGATASQKEALKAHKTPNPRCDVGLWLLQNHYASCMMDLSDGISTDLPRLCSSSNVGAEIYPGALPIFSASKSWKLDPLNLALNGGEDFELLFAVPRNVAAKFAEAYPKRFPRVTRIGILTSSKGIVLREASGKPARHLANGGFDHFN